jgi:transposase
LKANFVPPKPIRQLRNLTRYRKTQIQERVREVNRLHKALEDAGIKLDTVAADILGKSGRDMLDALVAGETEPQVLAELARRQMRKKIPALREVDFALEEAAMAAIRVKGHYLEAQYRRLKPRRGHKRALGAIKHTMICAIWHMLSTGETYRDLGGDYFTNRDPERQTRRLVAQLQRLGHHVTLTEGAAAT